MVENLPDSGPLARLHRTEVVQWNLLLHFLLQLRIVGILTLLLLELLLGIVLLLLLHVAGAFYLV
jgi:hypothetical protein